MNKNLILSLGSCAAFAFSMGSAAGGIVLIDHFVTPDTAPANKTSIAGAGSTSSLVTKTGYGPMTGYAAPFPGLTSIGGSRQVDLNITGGVFGESSAITGSGPGTEWLTTRIGNGAGPSKITLTYDNSGAGLGGVDLLDGTNLGFVFRLLDSDAATMATVKITGTNGFVATDVQNLPEYTFNGGIPTTFFLPYNMFSVTGSNTNAILTSVDKIEVIIDGTGNQDLTIDFLESGVVPEPSRALLALAGLIIGGLVRRRR